MRTSYGSNQKRKKRLMPAKTGRPSRPIWILPITLIRRAVLTRASKLMTRPRASPLKRDCWAGPRKSSWKRPESCMRMEGATMRWKNTAMRFRRQARAILQDWPTTPVMSTTSCTRPSGPKGRFMCPRNAQSAVADLHGRLLPTYRQICCRPTTRLSLLRGHLYRERLCRSLIANRGLRRPNLVERQMRIYRITFSVWYSPACGRWLKMIGRESRS